MRSAHLTEISAASSDSFDDAVKKGLKSAGKTLRTIESALVKEQNIEFKDGKIEAYRVSLLVTYVPDNKRNSGVAYTKEGDIDRSDRRDCAPNVGFERARSS